jgi:8-oxo-dGTP pyrophosphatase MutT (NUDIX family)
VAGALREAHEEAGIDPSAVAVRGEHVLAHPDWSYTTVLADEAGRVVPAVTDAESAAVEWVPVDQVTARPLLTAFADASAAEPASTTRGEIPLSAPPHVRLG